MNFQDLLGKTFTENGFYELLLFEIEENFENYFAKNFHIYFDRLNENKICITEFVSFETTEAFDQAARAIIEKKEWFEIYENHGHIDLALCRFDRSGKGSIVYKDKTKTQKINRFGWLDEDLNEAPLTEEEMRKGFQELAEIFMAANEPQKLKSKKSV